MGMWLSNDEIDACRVAFANFDKDNSGTIDMLELRDALREIGQHPTEEELFMMIAQVDDDGTGGIEFSEFLKVILNQKTQAAERADERDTIDAFVAMGGSADKTGVIQTDKLVRVIQEFELQVDVEALLSDTDQDKSGFIDYKEFYNLLNS